MSHSVRCPCRTVGQALVEIGRAEEVSYLAQCVLHDLCALLSGGFVAVHGEMDPKAVEGAQFTHPLAVFLCLMAQLTDDFHNGPVIVAQGGSIENGMKGLHTGVAFCPVFCNQLFNGLGTDPLHGIIGGAAHNITNGARVDVEGAGNVATGAAASFHAQDYAEALGFIYGTGSMPDVRSCLGRGLGLLDATGSKGGARCCARHAFLPVTAQGGLVHAVVGRDSAERPPRR